jgi:MFS family permease
MVVFGVYNSFGVFFDPMLSDFGWSKALTSGAFAVSTLVQGLAAILCGKFTDKIGPRLVMTVCGILLGAGYVLMAYISNAFQFYLVYGVIIGIGVGGFWVPLLSTVSRWFSRRRGLMLGIFLTGAGLGIFIMPPIINWMIQNYQWRLASTIIGFVTLLFCILLPQFIKRDPSVIGLLPDGDSGNLKYEESSDNKGYRLKEAISTRQFWLILALFTCYGLYSYIIVVHIVPHALYSGISPAAAANILAVYGIFSGVGGFAIGIIADGIGVKKVGLVCFLILFLALLWLLAFQNIWQLYLFAAVFGFAFGGIGVVEMLSIVWLFGLKSNAFILASVDIGLVFGAAVGPVIAGYIYDTTNSYQLAFILCAGASLAAFLLMIVIKPKTQS